MPSNNPFSVFSNYLSRVDTQTTEDYETLMELEMMRQNQIFAYMMDEYLRRRNSTCECAEEDPRQERIGVARFNPSMQEIPDEEGKFKWE